MTDKTLCLTKPPCPSWTVKQCGHAVLYGPGACWRRDGRPERCVGLDMVEGWRSPFEGGGEE